MKILLILISFLFSWVYFGLIYFYLKGWLKTPNHNIRTNYIPKHKVSIILPVRNEEDYLSACIQSILDQNYPKEQFELCIVNDFSTDRTKAIATQFANQHEHVRLLNLNEFLSAEYASIPNKKRGITLAVNQSNYHLIQTVDGDCVYPPNWLLSMVQYYEKHPFKLLTGPVNYSEVNSFWRKFLLMDLVSMIGITAGSIAQNRPVMANGANLMFEKKVFKEIDGYSGNEHIASGDDVYLMQKVHQSAPNSIGFVKDIAAMASTKVPATFREFINQRIRWTSKSGKMADKKVTIILIINYLFYLSVFLCLFVLPFYDLTFLGAGIVIFGVKVIVDGLFFGNILSFFKEKRLLQYLIPMEMLHLIYVTFMGVLAIFGTYRWKGRKVSK